MMAKRVEVGEEVTTVEWAIVVDEGYGPDVIVRSEPEDRAGVERLLAGIRHRSDHPEAVHLVSRVVVTSPWVQSDA